MVNWCFSIVPLCFCCLPATAIQSTRRLALPIFSEVLPAADPEPVVKNSSSYTAATKTVIPQTTIATFATTGSFFLLTLPSLESTARAPYETTAPWLPPTRKTTRLWRSTRLPLGNRTAPRKKISVLPAARFARLPAFGGPHGYPLETGQPLARRFQSCRLQDLPCLQLYQALLELRQRWEQCLTLNLLPTRPYPRCQPMKPMRLPSLRMTIPPCYR